MLKDSERNYYLDEVQRYKNNPGSLWKIVNQAINRQKVKKNILTPETQRPKDSR
jgi:hypothetical protein